MKLIVRFACLLMGVALAGLGGLTVRSSAQGQGNLAPVFAQTAAATAPAVAATRMVGYPRTVKSPTGEDITIAAKPMRIVSVALVSDEVLLSLVEPARLVAITTLASDPSISPKPSVEAAKAIQGKLAKADPEAILAFKPDLIFITSFTDAGVIKQLRDTKIPLVLLSKFDTLKDIEANVTFIGAVVGEESKAAAIVADMQQRLTRVDQALKGVKPKSVIYYGFDGYSWGENTIVNELITRAGGANAVITGGIKEQFPKLSEEFIIKQDPDVILVSTFSADAFRVNTAFKGLKAVKNNQVAAPNDAYLSTVSHYVVEGVEELAALLHPQAYQKPSALPVAATPATRATAAATASR